MKPIKIFNKDFESIKQIASINKMSIANVIKHLLDIFYYTPVQDNHWLDPED